MAESKRSRVRKAPITVDEAREELDRVHRLYSEAADIVENEPGSLNQTQLNHYAARVPGLREDCQLALALFQEATHRRDAESNNAMARSVRFWAIVAGAATAVQAIVALTQALCGGK